jgi:hypothetical protein
MCQNGAIGMAANANTYDDTPKLAAGASGYIEILHPRGAFLPAGAEHPFT